MAGYEVRESLRAKHVRITVYPDGRVVVTKPVRVSARKVEELVAPRSAWIEKTVEKFKAKEERTKKWGPKVILPKPRKGSKAYEEARKRARTLVVDRLTYFNTTYNTAYGSISIRNQKTRWGSCSAKGNLSFTYRIALLPSELADYLIVHELCHTIEHNHSPRFWEQVARTIPQYAVLRNELKRYRL